MINVLVQYKYNSTRTIVRITRRGCTYKRIGIPRKCEYHEFLPTLWYVSYMMFVPGVGKRPVWRASPPSSACRAIQSREESYRESKSDKS